MAASDCFNELEKFEKLEEEGWVKISGATLESSVTNLPVTIKPIFQRGSIQELDAFKAIFTDSFIIHQILPIVNAHLEMKSKSVSKKSKSRYSAINARNLEALIRKISPVAMQIRKGNVRYNAQLFYDLEKSLIGETSL